MKQSFGGGLISHDMPFSIIVVKDSQYHAGFNATETVEKRISLLDTSTSDRVSFLQIPVIECQRCTAHTVSSAFGCFCSPEAHEFHHLAWNVKVLPCDLRFISRETTGPYDP